MATSMHQTIELLMRLFSDPPPSQPADFAFMFGQTVDNQHSVLQRACELLNEGRVKKVGFMQAPPLSGYPGFAAWQQILSAQGIKPDQMEGVPFSNTDIIHTGIEAEAMVHHVRQKDYQCVYVLSAPFQQLRAFMNAVTLAVQHYPELQLYSMPGLPLPWQEEVMHSQGKVSGTRIALIGSELERIATYMAKGDLGSVELALDYLNRRG